jgi:hypothetical protein
MNEPSYPFKSIEDKFTFEFESVSNEKTIRKLIQFRLIDSNLTLYNLALVDVLDDKTVSDLSISNNQDMPKVLSTVFQSITYFFEKNSTAKVLIQGSTKSRTRLYQMAIVKYLSEIEQNYSIWGFINNEIELFAKGKNYNGFIITQK